jgi:hypothetical protein
MILATLRDLARALHCRPDQADDVLRSGPSARAALSRRGLFKAAGAVAAGVAFSDRIAPLVIFVPIDTGLRTWLKPGQPLDLLWSLERTLWRNDTGRVMRVAEQTPCGVLLVG